jgi:hypothetical protein
MQLLRVVCQLENKETGEKDRFWLILTNFNVLRLIKFKK